MQEQLKKLEFQYVINNTISFCSLPVMLRQVSNWLFMIILIETVLVELCIERIMFCYVDEAYSMRKQWSDLHVILLPIGFSFVTQSDDLDSSPIEWSNLLSIYRFLSIAFAFQFMFNCFLWWTCWVFDFILVWWSFAGFCLE